MKKYLILDIIDFLKTPGDKSQKPLLYSTKGMNIWINRDRLAILRGIIKDGFDLVHNPSRYSRITVLDMREMFKTFNCHHEAITMVADELYRHEEDFANLFRAEEFILYHVRPGIDYKIWVNDKAEVYKEQMRYYKKHLPERLAHIESQP
jgi:hypothetical protein